MQKIKILNRKNFLCLLLIFFTFMFDRLTKIKIINLQTESNQIYINDFINIDLVWNTGIAFGLMSFDSYIFYHSITLIIGAVIIFLIYLTIKAIFFEKLFFSLIIGGALGNFYDRLVFTAVPDFIDVHYQSFHWFTFNIADIFITIGIVMLIANELFYKKDV